MRRLCPQQARFVQANRIHLIKQRAGRASRRLPTVASPEYTASARVCSEFNIQPFFGDESRLDESRLNETE